jgi:4-amino-4-deoxy-L-arabinose transferase-like glycosyltransferase
MKKMPLLLLVLILICGAIARFYGLHRQGFISWDEGMYMNEALFYQSVIANAATIARGLLTGQLQPDQLIETIQGWPPSSAKPLHSLFIYLFSLVLGLDVFAAQCMSACFGLALILMMFLLSRLYFSDEIALCCALFIAFSGYHIYISRLGVPETDSLFFYVLALYLIEKYKTASSYVPYVVAGLAAGICFGLNYRWIIVLPVLFLNVGALIFAGTQNVRFGIKRFFVFALAFVCVPLVCDMPYWPLRFVDGFSISFRHAEANVYAYLDQLRYYLFFQSGSGKWHIHDLYIRMFVDFNGVLLTSLSVIGFVLLLKKPRIQNVVCILSALIPFVLLSVKSRGNSIRYISIALPFISLYAALAFSSIMNRLIRPGRRHAVVIRVVIVFFVCALSLKTALPFLTMNSGYAEAARFMRANNGEKSLATTNPYFEFYFGRNVAEQTPRTREDLRAVLETGDYRYVVLDFMAHRVLPRETRRLIQEGARPIASIPNQIGTHAYTLMESLGYRHFISGYLEDAYADPFSQWITIYDAADVLRVL